VRDFPAQSLKESEKLPQPVFTPSTKAEAGIHDENISFGKVVDILGRKQAEQIKDLSLKIYQKGSEFASQKGIIIADTKFEFGLKDGRLILIDEVLTPDSSRFWPVDTYKAGGPQQSFDKQFLRDYLESLAWPKQPPPPRLPRRSFPRPEKDTSKLLNASQDNPYKGARHTAKGSREPNRWEFPALHRAPWTLYRPFISSFPLP